MNDTEDAARTKLTPDSWHQDEEGHYYVDCPECGSAASVMNVVSHGRCNGYLNQLEEDTDLDEREMDCSAKLWFELAYVSDPSEDVTSEAIGDTSTGHEDDSDGEGVTAEGEPEGADGLVDDTGSDG